MTFSNNIQNYWTRKLQAYLHDPFDKIFKIPGHEDRAGELLNILGEDAPNDKFWKQADQMAAGIERGTVPGYKADEKKSGAVDFSKHPTVTHPTGREGELLFQLPDDATPEQIISELKEKMRTFIGEEPGKGGYSERFINNYTGFSVAKFFYLHLALRFKLAEQEDSKLGQLWHRIPADSRFPDHTIWNHNQLVSAINSCMDFVSENTDADVQKHRRNNAGLSVFSISPVQGFISKSRKLRDFWVSSILLSYLSFEGIRWVMENLGPDHILYPSLIDQPLVAEYMRNELNLKDKDAVELWEKHSKDIATFPNKFLFLCPLNREEEIHEAIEKHIQNAWNDSAEKVRVFTIKKLQMEETDHYKKLWERQNSSFWEFSHATVKLATLSDKDELLKLFNEDAIKDEVDIVSSFKKMAEEIYGGNQSPLLYGTSHSLVQGVLAAEKSKKTACREEEPGEKCQLCGQLEVLHTEDCSEKPARVYKKHYEDVWSLINADPDGTDIKENERLCSVCMIKRFLPQVLGNKKNEDHLLYCVFKDNDSFPSTSEMALHNYFERENIKNSEKQKSLATDIYVNGRDIGKNRDKYYAILMMDGDKMGDLINGKTIGASWKSIMHPEMRRKLEKNNKFDDVVNTGWKKLMEKNIRSIIPAVHASISESLGDFAIYGVAKIVKKYDGRLIYAGGDDVAAVMPVDTVLKAAQEIRKYYTQAFRSIKPDGTTDMESIGEDVPGKLSAGLGNAERISISAGILICHHKEALSQMIERVHTLLDEKAKNECGRNACAIELKKRSGGSRYIAAKWDDPAWGAFEALSKEKLLSTSLIYRLEKFRDGIEVLKNNKTQLTQFFAKQIERSGYTIPGENKEEKAKNLKKYAEHVVDIGLFEKKGEKAEKEILFEPERLIVAEFFTGSEEGGVHESS